MNVNVEIAKSVMGCRKFTPTGFTATPPNRTMDL